ncbi:hypothetical protein ACRAWD_27525 [Caulobacter segnis]
MHAVPDARVGLLRPTGRPASGRSRPALIPRTARCRSAPPPRSQRQMRDSCRPSPIRAHPRRPVGPEIADPAHAPTRPPREVRLGRHRRQAARVATVGDIDANVAKLTHGRERRIPIRVRLPADSPPPIWIAPARLRMQTASGEYHAAGVPWPTCRFQAGSGQDRPPRPQAAR